MNGQVCIDSSNTPVVRDGIVAEYEALTLSNTIIFNERNGTARRQDQDILWKINSNIGRYKPTMKEMATAMKWRPVTDYITA